MQCPKCTSENADGAKFCNECGFQLSALSHESEGDFPSMGAAVTIDGAPPGLSMGDLRTCLMAVGEAEAAGCVTGAPLESRYEVLGEVGRGGFAVVSKARDKKLGRLVAVKRLLPDKASGHLGQQVVERFRREAQSIAKLNHLNIVTVYDHDCDRNGYYIVMEYVEGGSLRDYLKAHGGKMPVAAAVRLIRGVAQGLAYAHRMNLVHRDIKPANILLSLSRTEEGEGDGGSLIPKLVDFGLARSGTETDMSVSGFGMGTPFYAAPEQRRDAKNVNHTADIYSLGKTLYELVTGEIPDTIDSEVIPPPAELAKIIAKCVKPNPGDRYFSADEVIAALTLVVGKESSFAAAGGKAAGAADACPGCGLANAKDSRFCQGCGTGLFRPCPECGRELSVQAPFCAACGTDVAAFLQIQDCLGRIGRYRVEKKYSRILKECELVFGEKFVSRGSRATALLDVVRESQAEATDAESRKKELSDAIQAAWKIQDCDHCETLLRQYKEICGTLEDELLRLHDRLPVVRQTQGLRRHLEALEAAIHNRNWLEAQTLFSHPPPVPQAEAEDDKLKVDLYRAEVDALHVRMSEAQAAQHGQTLKQLRAEAVSAMERGEWPLSWRLIHSLGDLPAAVMPAHRVSLAEQSEELLSLSNPILKGWLGLLSGTALQYARQRKWNEAWRTLKEVDDLPAEAALRRECSRELEMRLRELQLKQQASDKVAGEVVGLFQRRQYQACAELCETLSDPSDELSRFGVNVTVGVLRDEAVRCAEALAARIEAMKRALAARDWQGTIRLASGLLRESGGMREAKDALAQALAGRRKVHQIRFCIGAVLLSVAGACIWGKLWVDGLRRNREYLLSAALRGDSLEAERLSGALPPWFAPQKDLWRRYAGAKAGFVMLRGEKGESAWGLCGGEAYIVATNLAAQAAQSFEAGDLEAGLSGMEKAARALEDASANVEKSRKSLEQKWDGLKKEYDHELAACDLRLLNEFGGDPWKEVKDLWKKAEADAGTEIGCCAFAEASKGLANAVACATRSRAEKYRRTFDEVTNKCHQAVKLAAASGGWREYDAVAQCTNSIAGLRQSDVFRTREENAVVGDVLAEVMKSLATAYRGPVRGDGLWAVPETGLVFVWVEKYAAWVGQTEVRNEDFRRHFPQHVSKGRVGDLNGEDQPAVRLTFDEAVEFAQRLTDGERKMRRLPDGYVYRLLSSEEWITCAQCGDGRTYPWGDKEKHGNYADWTAFHHPELKFGIIADDDHYAVSAPVGMNGTNEWALCDMGGNVSEWVTRENLSYAVCDASWRTDIRERMKCDFIPPLPKTTKQADDIGLRLILAKPR